MNIAQPLSSVLVPQPSQPIAENISSSVGEKNSTAYNDSQTNALIDEISSSGPYLWSFKLYWIVAAQATLATILLPLVAGMVYRNIVKFVYNNRIYSRTSRHRDKRSAVPWNSLGLARHKREPFLCAVCGRRWGLLLLIALIRYSFPDKYPWTWSTFTILYASFMKMNWYFMLLSSLTGALLCIIFIIWLLDPLPPRGRLKKIAIIINMAISKIRKNVFRGPGRGVSA